MSLRQQHKALAVSNPVNELAYLHCVTRFKVSAIPRQQTTGRQTAPLPIGRSSLTTTKDSCRRYFFDQPAGTSPLVIEVVTLFDVRDQCRALRPPSQQFLCLLARRRVVGRHEGGEEAEVGARVRSLDADNRQLQLPADSLSDFPERHALLADSVQSRASRGGFHGQPEQARRIESMHGRPAVRSIADEG